mgnify:FL=1
MPTTHTCYAAIDIGSNAVRLLIKKVKDCIEQASLKSFVASCAITAWFRCVFFRRSVRNEGCKVTPVNESFPPTDEDL